YRRIHAWSRNKRSEGFSSFMLQPLKRNATSAQRGLVPLPERSPTRRETARRHRPDSSSRSAPWRPGTRPREKRLLESESPRLARQLGRSISRAEKAPPICFRHPPQAILYFASLGNEVVVRINYKKRSNLLVICHVRHSISPTIVCWLGASHWALTSPA